MDEKEVVITYDTLFDLTRREKYRKEIQPLVCNFYKDVVNYLEEKQSILKSQEAKDSVFSAVEADKTRLQLANAKKILRDLYEKREAKIVQDALYQSRGSGKAYDFTGFLPEEKEFFAAIESTLAKFREEILNKLLTHKLPSLCKEKPKSLKIEEDTKLQGNLVRLKCPVPQFVGPDMNAYGPFEAGQAVDLPECIRDMLLNNGNAETEG